MIVYPRPTRDDPVPDRIFKYARRRDALAMVRYGEVGIGNLYYYNSLARVAAGIHDPKEGTRVFKEFIPSLFASSSWLARETLRSLRNAALAGRRIDVRDSVIAQEEQCPNEYLYSTSLVCDESIMRRMHPDYDSIVLISDPLAFIRAVSKAFRKKLPHLGDGHYWIVKYSRELHPSQTDLHPLELKEPRDAYQEEFRFTWGVPPEKTIRPDEYHVVRAPKIRPYCALLSPRDYPRYQRPKK
jgi:hypothetical protein